MELKMYIEERNYYHIPFSNALMNHYSNEKVDFFRSYNNSLCSIMVIGFMKNNPKFKTIDMNNILDFVDEFEKFIRSFKNYDDIESYFFNSIEPLNMLFKESSTFINKNIPEDIQWTIKKDEDLVKSSLLEIKRTFKHCSELIKNECGSEMKTLLSIHIGKRVL